MAATPRPLLPMWHFSFLKEGLLLPARNPVLFGPILVLIVAEQVIHSVALLVMLFLLEAQSVVLVGAVSLLSFLIASPVIGAITTFAAVTAFGVNNEGETPTFVQVLRRLFDGGGLLTVGPVVTAIHGQILAFACRLGIAALLFLIDLLVRYTRTLLLLDLLVLVFFVASLAQLYLGVVVSMAVVVSASEPGCDHAAALHRAWVTTAKNAPQAVILLIANGMLTAAISPWNIAKTTFGHQLITPLVYLLVASVAQVFSACAVTAFYNECRQREQEHAEEVLLIEAGEDWLDRLSNQCRNKLQNILQGRFSMRHMLATLLVPLQRLCIWMLAFVSTQPWVAGIAVVCVYRLVAEGPPLIFYRNGLVSYRNFLRQKYHMYPKGCVGRW